MRYAYSLILFFFVHLSLFSNGQNLVDSLRKEIQKEKTDSIRCRLYRDLGFQFRNENFDTAIYYYKKSLEISEKRNFKSQTAISLRFLGISYTNTGDYNKSLDYHERSLKICELLNDSNSLFLIYTNIGNVFYYQGYFEKAIDNYLKSLKIAEKLRSSEGISNAYYNLGNVYYDQKSFNKAIDYYNLSLEISQEIGNKNAISECYSVIGIAYYELKEYDKSLDYLNQAIKLASEENNLRVLSACYNNVGLVYSEMGLYDKAIENYKQSLSLFKQTGEINGVMEGYLSISSMNLVLADSVALTENQRVNYLNKSVENGLQAFEIASQINSLPFINSTSKVLSDAYEKLQNIELAFKYSKIYISTRDIMFSDEKTKAIAEIGARYEDEKKQLTIENLRKQNLLQTEKSKKQTIINYALIFIIILSVGFAFVLFYGYRQKKKANKILENKNILINQQKEEILGQTEELQAINDHLVNVNNELEKLSIVARKTENAIIIMDGKGDLLWTNEAFERIYGISLEQHIKTYGCNILDATMNPDAKALIKECVSEGNTITYITKFSTDKGFDRWSQTNITPILDEKEKVYRLVAVDSDITNLKIAEQEILSKNQKITDSISYAKRIQLSFLPSLEQLAEHFRETFIIYRPKDIVSGDFYWFHSSDTKSICVLADCTGHGVPGAFMSLIGNTLLNEIIINRRIFDPVEILEKLDYEVKKILKVDSDNENDGMAISICVIDRFKKKIILSCAEQNLLFYDNGKVVHLEPSFYGVGFGDTNRFPFTEETFDLNGEQRIYLFSDGYSDQFGGPEGKKFMSGNFTDILTKNVNLSMQDQKELLDRILNNWMSGKHYLKDLDSNFPEKKFSQIDDITVLGLTI